jgi:hypothetical protein
MKFAIFNALSITSFSSWGICFDARACLWIQQCVQETFVATSFVRATNTACLPVIDVAHLCSETNLFSFQQSRHLWVWFIFSSVTFFQWTAKLQLFFGDTSIFVYVYDKTNKIARLATSVDSFNWRA